MTDNQTKVPLTAEQVAARKAALEASTGTPNPANVPPVTAKVEGTTTAPKPEKPISDLLTAATTALSNGTKGEADKAVAALATAANKPVEPVTKPQGGKPTTANPHTNPVPNGKQGGTVTGNRGAPSTKVNPKVDVSATPKPKKQGKAATALADKARVAGFDLNRWPKTYPGIDNPEQFKPTEADILAARALGQGTSIITINELNLAAELGRNVFTVKRSGGTVAVEANVNVFTIGDLCGPVLGRSGDHKMNWVHTIVRRGLAGFVKHDGTLLTGPNARATEAGQKHNGKVCYGIKLTPRGVKLVEAQLGVGKVPQYMLPPGEKPATAGKGTVQASKPATALQA